MFESESEYLIGRLKAEMNNKRRIGSSSDLVTELEEYHSVIKKTGEVSISKYVNALKEPGKCIIILKTQDRHRPYCWREDVSLQETTKIINACGKNSELKKELLMISLSPNLIKPLVLNETRRTRGGTRHKDGDYRGIANIHKDLDDFFGAIEGVANKDVYTNLLKIFRGDINNTGNTLSPALGKTNFLYVIDKCIEHGEGKECAQEIKSIMATPRTPKAPPFFTEKELLNVFNKLPEGNVDAKKCLFALLVENYPLTVKENWVLSNRDLAQSKKTQACIDLVRLNSKTELIKSEIPSWNKCRVFNALMQSDQPSAIKVQGFDAIKRLATFIREEKSGRKEDFLGKITEYKNNEDYQLSNEQDRNAKDSDLVIKALSPIFTQQSSSIFFCSLWKSSKLSEVAQLTQDFVQNSLRNNDDVIPKMDQLISTLEEKNLEINVNGKVSDTTRCLAYLYCLKSTIEEKRDDTPAPPLVQNMEIERNSTIQSKM